MTTTFPGPPAPAQFTGEKARPRPAVGQMERPRRSGFVLRLFCEVAGLRGHVPGAAPGFADGPVGGPCVVTGLAGGLLGPSLVALGVLKPPGQVGDALLGLLLRILRPALLLLGGSQLVFPVVEVLLGLNGQLPGPLQTFFLLAAPGTRGLEIGHLTGGPGGTAFGRYGCRLSLEGGEAGRGGQRLRQTALRPSFGRLRIGQDRVQGVLNLLPDIVADALPGLCRELAGLPGQGKGDLVLLRRQLSQLFAVQLLMRLPQRLTQLQQPLHLVGLLAHQQVTGPRRQRRAAQTTDLLRQLTVTGRAGGLRMLVTGSGEVTRRKAVQLTGNSVQIHPSHPPESIC